MQRALDLAERAYLAVKRERERVYISGLARTHSGDIMRSVPATWVPIEQWPGEATKPGERRDSPFSGSWQSTMDLLDRELFHIGARDVVLEGFFSRAQLRLDGSLRADATPSSPGIVLSFKRDGQTFTFPCDTFETWRDNLRALALALEALRKVERYGVTRRHEQYAGWLKLPPAPEPGKMTPEAAKQFLELHSEPLTVSAETFKQAYRTAAAKLHPDNPQTGHVHLFNLLGQAKQALIDAYGWQA